jgi:dTDP-4-dehydrorhamnose reductase
MNRVWVTGAGGLIGHALASAAPAGLAAAGLTRAALDLTDEAAVTERFRRDAPAAVIHAAGLTRNPACTADPALARRLNVGVTRRLADLCGDAGVPLVFFSTDLVFDGRKGAPYAEADPVNPQGVYAETKAEAERVVLAGPRNLVLRTSLNYGRSPTGDRAFNEELVRAWAAGRETTLFTDEFRCPLPAAVTAQAAWELLRQALDGDAPAAARPAGIFHLAGAERLSRWRLGELLAARHPDLRPRLVPASLRDYAGPPRPPDCSLDCARVQARLSFPLPRFSEWLAATTDDGLRHGLVPEPRSAAEP